MCHYRDGGGGGMNDIDFPHEHSRFGLLLPETCMQQESGLAEPCSLTLRRGGGVGCKELNRQASTLQGGVKRGGDIQLGRCKTRQ